MIKIVISLFVMLGLCANTMGSLWLSDIGLSDSKDIISKAPIEDNALSVLENFDEKNEIKKVIEVYDEFLSGLRQSEEGIDIKYLTIPTGETDRRYGTDYAYFDSNRDGLPELHVRSRNYYIFTYRDNKLVIWSSFVSSTYYYALNDGAFMSYCVGVSGDDVYEYFVNDYFGEIICTTHFSKREGYDSDLFKDFYMFNGVDVTKEIWEKLTEPYLSTDENGVKKIRNEIEWTVLYEEVW